MTHTTYITYHTQTLQHMCILLRVIVTLVVFNHKYVTKFTLLSGLTLLSRKLEKMYASKI